MGLLTPGHWPATSWPAGHWPDDHWPEYSSVTVYDGITQTLSDSGIISQINVDSGIISQTLEES